MQTSKYAARRTANIPKVTIWTEFSGYCAQHAKSVVNMGQGFPNFNTPQYVLDFARDAVSDPAAQQYAPQRGHPALIDALARRYSRTLQRPIAADEICICNGTTQALSIAMTAFVNPEEEVIIFEPYFDLYGNDIELAHGQIKMVPLVPPRDSRAAPYANAWALDFDVLEAAVTPGKTKGILINTPQNVPGKVWSRAELEKIAALAKKHDLLVFADEVYDRFVFNEAEEAQLGLPRQEHVSIATLPDMWGRVITMCSAGKTYTVTGWKQGWMIAPRELMVSCMQIQAHQVFSVATPLQIAVAKAINQTEEPKSTFYDDLRADYARRRTLMVDGIKAAGLVPIVPQGSYFVMADISGVPPALYMDKESSAPLMPGCPTDVRKDFQFCRWMVREIGVACLPCTAFCSKENGHLYDNFVRFAFCKKDEDIVAASAKMKEKLAPLLQAQGSGAAAAAAADEEKAEGK